MISKIQKWVRRFLHSSLFRFLIVGVINTLVGTAVMFLLYNCIPWDNRDAGYWVSTAANYVIGGICSFFLNKYFTFRSKERSWAEVARFILEQVVCYLLAYGLAKPAVRALLSGMEPKLRDNITMLAGMCLFVVLNYFGQRFFAFRKREDKKEA